MNATFCFELKDSEPDIYLQSLKMQMLIKVTAGISSEDNTYASITDPILKRKKEDSKQDKKQCKVHCCLL